jgi:predicted ATPase
MDERIDTGMQLQAMFMSHGESSKMILHALKDNLGPHVLSFDEPDMAMSPRSIYTMIRDLQANVQPESQVLLAVHNPEIIRAFTPVLSLEHGRWMPSAEFLKSHQNDPAPVFSKKPRKVAISRDPPKKIRKSAKPASP